MPNTRGNLEAARIYTVDEDGNEQNSGVSVSCMFNPFEYTVAKTNQFHEEAANDSDTPHGEFFKSGAQTLKLSLMFDTYESGDDVSQETNKLWKFMKPSSQEDTRQNERIEPPQVAFEWGVFKFVSFITTMTQKFTMFKPDGTPVRAKVEATFTQYTDVEDYPNQNPTSGGGPNERVHRVIAGERLDTIAAKVYRDATKWRLIAKHNKIVNPLTLHPGQTIRIPYD